MENTTDPNFVFKLDTFFNLSGMNDLVPEFTHQIAEDEKPTVINPFGYCRGQFFVKMFGVVFLFVVPFVMTNQETIHFGFAPENIMLGVAINAHYPVENGTIDIEMSAFRRLFFRL